MDWNCAVGVNNTNTCVYQGIDAVNGVLGVDADDAIVSGEDDSAELPELELESD